MLLFDVKHKDLSDLYGRLGLLYHFHIFQKEHSMLVNVLILINLQVAKIYKKIYIFGK